MGKCAGEEFAAFAGMAILSSYLFLFISFYIATYNKAAKTGRPRRNTGRQAVIDMAKMEVVPSANGSAANGNANGNAKSNRAATTSGRSNGPVTRSRKA